MNFDKDNVIPLKTPDADPPPQRAKRADAIANRELILDTAQKLFAEQGVANVCMAAIAEAAGVGKGTLYRGFANKGELCRPALTKLDAFLDQLVRFMGFHAPLLREAQMQGVLRDEITNQASPHMWLSWLHQTIGLLLQQAEQNDEAHNLDIPYLIDAILAPLNADLFMHQRETLGFDLERISQGLRRLVLRGCGNSKLQTER